MPSVFISYSHKDEEWKNRLRKHLDVLESQSLLDVWDDRQIGAGVEWLDEIQTVIERASVAVLLISADFLTSKFILSKEVPRLLKRRASDGLTIFPVIVRPCAWEKVKWLTGLQAWPRDGKALMKFGENWEKELTEITKEILQLVHRSAHPLTLLHLSDLQFGKNHRFARQDLSGWDAPFGTLLARLQEDLARLREDPGLVPDLLVVTGDLAEWGLKSEFEDALSFLRGICDFLKLPPSRVAIIPGNHDVNRKLCQSYFVECEGEEREPAFPYLPKWKHFTWFFREFYGDKPRADFTLDLPWSLFEIEDLKVVVAGLNSTLKESHRDEDHYGWVGEKQLQWFREKLEPFRKQGWLRIGAVHHNFRRAAANDDENLRDADDLQQSLGAFLNLLLHGHTHEGKSDLTNSGVPILSTGSAALTPGQRPPEVPNQYQIVRVWRNRVCHWTRGFAPDRKSWVGDNRASEDGSRWWNERHVEFVAVEASFPMTSPKEHLIASPEMDNFSLRDSPQERQDDFLDRVKVVCQFRKPQAKVERFPGFGAWGDYLRVCEQEGGITKIFPVGALDQEVSERSLQLFLSDVDARYRQFDPLLVSILVYGGNPAPGSLVRLAQERRIHLVSFIEYQGLIDFRPYVRQQTDKLASDLIYPPALYVPQRMRYLAGGRDEQETSDALATVQDWLSTQTGRFVVLLGDFGTGKTFLLHELARRMGEQERGPVPILLQMRSLEKGRDLNALLAQHFAQEGVEDFFPSVSATCWNRGGSLSSSTDSTSWRSA